MRLRSNFLLIAVILLLGSCSTKQMPKNEDLKLWYNQPASSWMTEALPLGNAYMGAMFLGGIEKERIQFTEESLWAGGPNSNDKYNFGNKKDAYKYLPKVRKLLAQGKFDEAHHLANKELSGEIHYQGGDYQSSDYGSQQTMGDLYISVDSKGKATNYSRELNISNATGYVTYEQNDITFKRTYFASYPKRALVYKLESSKPVSYTINYETPHQKVSESFKNNQYTFDGFVAHNKMAFETCYKIEGDAANVTFSDGKLTVKDATKVIIYQTAATEYLPKYPTYKGRDYQGLNKKTLDAIASSSYEQIYQEHISDYQNLHGRVALTLGSTDRDTIPTDERVVKYYNGEQDPAFEALYFQYNRYLMISGSRPGSMPLNLQGKWNESTNPPWSADYHMNINQQMLYWPAEVTNLNECHLPLFNYMETLVEPGKVSAKEFFNARGWIVNTMNNEFGFTAPGWNFPWGFFPGGAAWLCQHAWEHYAFTQDIDYLKTQGYPLMKEAALFWIDYLIKDDNGYLVSCPSYSPEHGGISTGASMDHQMAWDLLNNCVKACEVLNIDADFKAKAIAVRDQICPPMVGKWGQLQEWKEDVDDPNNQHRHVSHLFALFPGSQISIDQTPKLAKAAEVSLNARGDSGTGWSRAWKICFWARLRDGNHAHKMLKELLKPVISQKTEMLHGGGTYSNLLCAHPPFQLDGNMGGTAGISEMLLQSHANTINLLPALPDAWKQGSINGLCARGGYTIDIDWQNGNLTKATIHANKPGKCTIKYGKASATIDVQPGQPITLDHNLKQQ
ncbi:glycoside hydrolase family 95 protein [Puteibacter caeruleilacunae]|nr:glycoside hydrolase family 95 protein [Puteibacter caeruleilacunae]